MFCFSKLRRNITEKAVPRLFEADKTVPTAQLYGIRLFKAAVHHKINLTFGILVVDDCAFHNASVIHRNLDVEIVRSDVELLHRLKRNLNKVRLRCELNVKN
jgi:hypothetical protein